jgi:hypothetical protein
LKRIQSRGRFLLQNEYDKLPFICAISSLMQEPSAPPEEGPDEEPDDEGSQEEEGKQPLV